MPLDATPTVSEVIVRTMRLPAPPGDAAFSIVPIDEERLKAHPRLDEALATVPGAALFRRTSSRGANPTTQGMSLRAIAPSGAGRALVTLDGAPQNDPFGGWVIWTALPTEAIGAASITRGAGSGPYGAGALTGVISLDSVEGNRLHASLSGENHGGRRAAVAASGDMGGADLLFSAAAEHGDGWTPVRQGRGAADTPLQLGARSASMRVQTTAGAATVAARIGSYAEERSAGLVGAASRAQGLNASLAIARVEGDVGWRLQGWAALTDLRNSSVAVAEGRGSTTPANDQYETPASGYGLNAAWRGGGAFGQWEVGGDIRAAEGESREHFRYLTGAFTRDRRGGGRTLVGGLYAEGLRTMGPWLFTGGARIDRWSSADGKRVERDLSTGAVILDNRPADRSGWIPTARAGVRRDFDSLYGRAAAYAGFRAPTLNELHRPFRVGNDITEANAALAPEKLYGAEAGVGGAWWSLTAFYNVLQDPVTNVTVGVGPGTFAVAGFVPAGGVLRQRRNTGRIDAFGLEAEARAEVTDQLTVRGALAYTEARIDGGAAAPQLTGLRPAQAPRLRVNAGLIWRPTDRLSLSADVAYEGERFDDDLNSRRLTAATLVDVRVSFALRTGLEVYVDADNLFEQAVATGQTADGVFSYGPGRTVSIGLSIRL